MKIGDDDSLKKIERRVYQLAKSGFEGTLQDYYVQLNVTEDLTADMVKAAIAHLEQRGFLVRVGIKTAFREDGRMIAETRYGRRQFSKKKIDRMVRDQIRSLQAKGFDFRPTPYYDREDFLRKLRQIYNSWEP